MMGRPQAPDGKRGPEAAVRLGADYRAIRSQDSAGYLRAPQVESALVASGASSSHLESGVHLVGG